MSKSKNKNTLRIWNVNFLGGHLAEAIVLVGFGAFFVGVWLLGKLAEKGPWEKILVPLMGFAAFAAGLGMLAHAFRKYALWLELGDKIHYRMLTHSRTRKWSDVKAIKLGWESREYLRRVGLGYKEQRWRMLIIRFRDGALVKVHVKPKHEDRLQQFAGKLNEAALSLQSSD